MKNKRLLATMLIALVLVAVLAAAWVLYNRYQDALRANQQLSGQPAEEKSYITAPDFRMTDVDGNEVALSDFLGKPVLLNFWATWCGYCVAEMPDIAAAYDAYKEDIQFILLNCLEDRKTALTYMEENGYEMPVFFDNVSMQGQIAYSIRGIPQTAFITSDGKLFALHPGYMDAEVLERYLAGLLEYEAARK